MRGLEDRCLLRTKVPNPLGQRGVKGLIVPLMKPPLHVTAAGLALRDLPAPNT